MLISTELPTIVIALAPTHTHNSAAREQNTIAHCKAKWRGYMIAHRQHIQFTCASSATGTPHRKCVVSVIRAVLHTTMLHKYINRRSCYMTSFHNMIHAMVKQSCCLSTRARKSEAYNRHRAQILTSSARPQLYDLSKRDLYRAVCERRRRPFWTYNLI